MDSLTNSPSLPQPLFTETEKGKEMDAIMVALITEGVKTVLPAVISAMHQSGMTEEQVNAAWAAAYVRFKTEDPNLLPTS